MAPRLARWDPLREFALILGMALPGFLACAVVFVASASERTRLRHMSYLRATGTAASVSAVGFITIDEIVDLLEEASSDLVNRECAATIDDALRRLRTLDDA